MLIRKHPVVYFKIVFVFTVTILLPLIGFLYIWFHQYPFAEHYRGGVMVNIFSSLYVLYGLLFSCIAWVDDEFDVFIITDERLIDITQITLFQRSVASTPLNQIQDTTSHVNGVLATILNYGDVEVQTAAGSASSFFIDCVPNAPEVAREILDIADKHKNGTITEIPAISHSSTTDYRAEEGW